TDTIRADPTSQTAPAGRHQGSLRGGRPHPRPDPGARGKLRRPACPSRPGRLRVAAPGGPTPRPRTGGRGMKCQSCSNHATVPLPDIVTGQKKELHLCQACAEKQQLLQKQELNLPAILQALIGQKIGPLTDELSRLTCPTCGIKYMEFRAE